jgi:cytochrome c oxidase assembly protein subunit 15
MSPRRFAIYAWAVLGLNLLVVLWGAFVRATGSGAGCGSHWPLCNGEVVPRAPQVATIIEFTHRVTSGVALISILVLVIWAFRAYPPGHRVRLGAALSGIFIVTEALIGAGLVLFQQVAYNASLTRAFSLSIHLVNTFTLIAFLALTAWWAHPGTSPRDSFLQAARSLPWLLGSALALLMLLGVSGAIAALGDTLFPASSLAAGVRQDFSPTAHIFLRLRALHPGIAIVAIVFLLWAVMRILKQYKTRITQPLGLAVMGLALLQLLVGAVNLGLLAPVPLQLVHLLVADLLWIAAVLFSAAVLAGRKIYPL